MFPTFDPHWEPIGNDPWNDDGPWFGPLESDWMWTTRGWAKKPAEISEFEVEA